MVVQKSPVGAVFILEVIFISDFLNDTMMSAGKLIVNYNRIVVVPAYSDFFNKLYLLLVKD